MFLLAGVGASAHSGLSLSRFIGVQSSTFGNEATGARTEPADTPEPTETAEAPQTAEPAETETEVDTDVDNDVDTDVETDDDNGAATAPTTKHESEQETGDHHDSTSKESDD